MRPFELDCAQGRGPEQLEATRLLEQAEELQRRQEQADRLLLRREAEAAAAASAAAAAADADAEAGRGDDSEEDEVGTTTTAGTTATAEPALSKEQRRLAREEKRRRKKEKTEAKTMAEMLKLQRDIRGRQDPAELAAIEAYARDRDNGGTATVSAEEDGGEDDNDDAGRSRRAPRAGQDLWEEFRASSGHSDLHRDTREADFKY